MIHPISTPKRGRTDICISLSDKNLKNLMKLGQPILLLAEVGMEQETVAVAEALTAQMTDGMIGDIDIFSDYLLLQPEADDSTVNTNISRALAGLPPHNSFSTTANYSLKPVEVSKKPLLIDRVDLLSFTHQNYLLILINCGKVQVFNAFNKEELGVRQFLFSLAGYKSIFAPPGRRLLDYLRRHIHPQLLDKVLPGLIELLPLRKAIDYVDSYVDLYLKGLKKQRDTSESLRDEVYIEPEALEVLKAHSWPGNYDELRIILKRCSIFAGDDPVSLEDIEAALEGFCIEEKSVEAALKYDVPQKFELDKVMKSTEAHLIEQILKNAKTLKEASDILGFNSPQAFDKRIRTLGVTLPAHLGRKGSRNSSE